MNHTTTEPASIDLDKLLPCPFCGGTETFVERLDYSAAYVQCDSRIDEHCACLARGPVGVQDDDGEEIPGGAAAIRAWNNQAALITQARASQPEGATGTTGATVIWPSEKFVHERIATLMAEIGMPDDTPLWNAFSRFEADLRSRVEAMPAFPATATASIDTMEFQALAGTWCGAAQSCDQWTRTIGAKQAWADIIAHIDTIIGDLRAHLAAKCEEADAWSERWLIEKQLAAPASAQPDRGAAQFCQHCGYDHSAGPLCITAAALSPASQPVAPEAAQTVDFETWFDREYPMVDGRRPKYQDRGVMALMGDAWDAAKSAHAQQEAAPAEPEGFSAAVGAWLSARDYWQDDEHERVKQAWAALLKFAVAPSDAKDATVPDHSERGAANVAAGLRGLAGHIRACETYKLLRGDMEIVDQAIAILSIAAGQEAANAKDAAPGAHHLTPDNIAALIADMKACEEGSESPSIFDRDWRTQCGVIWRVMEHLACGKPTLPQAARDVMVERRRQVEVEGWTPEHDDKYTNCELARAAATYALCSHIEQLALCGEIVWPWHPDWWKRTTYRRDLVKAGALVIAEIERIDRAAMAAAPSSEKGGA